MIDQKRPAIHVYPPPAAIEKLKHVNGAHWREAGGHLLETYLLKLADPGTIIHGFSDPSLKNLSTADRTRVADAMTQAASKEVRLILSARLLERAREIAAEDPSILRRALEEAEDDRSSETP